MKMLFVGVFVLFISSHVQAKEPVPFDEKALQLLNSVFTHCPIEFIQAMKGANRVGTAFYQIDEESEVITLTTLGGGYAPTFESYEVANLKISKTRMKEENPALDAPARFQVGCHLVDLRK